MNRELAEVLGCVFDTLASMDDQQTAKVLARKIFDFSREYRYYYEDTQAVSSMIKLGIAKEITPNEVIFVGSKEWDEHKGKETLGRYGRYDLQSDIDFLIRKSRSDLSKQVNETDRMVRLLSAMSAIISNPNTKI